MNRSYQIVPSSGWLQATVFDISGELWALMVGTARQYGYTMSSDWLTGVDTRHLVRTLRRANVADLVPLVEYLEQHCAGGFRRQAGRLAARGAPRSEPVPNNLGNMTDAERTLHIRETRDRYHWAR